MKFFAEITSSNQPKNKAEEACQKLVAKYHKALATDETTRDDIIAAIEKGIESINSEYKRCGDVHTDKRSYDWMPESESNGEISLYIGTCTIITFRNVLNEF